MAEMQPDHEGSWRCTHDLSKFCPPEGCPEVSGCARLAVVSPTSVADRPATDPNGSVVAETDTPC